MVAQNMNNDADFVLNVNPSIKSDFNIDGVYRIILYSRSIPPKNVPVPSRAGGIDVGALRYVDVLMTFQDRVELGSRTRPSESDGW